MHNIGNAGNPDAVAAGADSRSRNDNAQNTLVPQIPIGVLSDVDDPDLRDLLWLVKVHGLMYKVCPARELSIAKACAFFLQSQDYLATAFPF